jgi:hypothetical protein
VLKPEKATQPVRGSSEPYTSTERTVREKSTGKRGYFRCGKEGYIARYCIE